MVWDVSSFGNEQAQDWLKDLIGSTSGDMIEEALAKVDRSDMFIDGQDAERGIAAAETVAASWQKPSENLPQELILWLKTHSYKSSPDTVRVAARVVDKVAKNSELRDLWDGTDASVSWQRTIADLKERLEAIDFEEENDSGDTADEAVHTNGQADAVAAPVVESATAAGALQGDPEAIFNEAVELVAAGNHRGAVGKFNHALELDDSFVLGYIGRGTSYLATGKFSEAVSDFNSAIDREPDIPDAYYLRAQAYFQQSNYGRAIADLSILVSMAPNKLDAYVMRGIANFSLGRDKKALEDFTLVISKDAGMANAYYHRAKVYEREGQFDLAGKDRSEYERLLSKEKV